MPPSQYVEVAYFLKTYGLQGELRTVILDDVQLDFTTLDSIFIKIKGQYIPYFIESVQADKEVLIIKLDEVDSPEAASKLRGERIYITEDKLSDQGTSSTFESLDGYTAFDQGKSFGTIKALEEYPQQVMAIIDVNGKDIMIPMIDELVTKIDDQKKEVHFHLPEGLLEL